MIDYIIANCIADVRRAQHFNYNLQDTHFEFPLIIIHKCYNNGTRKFRQTT